MDNDIKKTNISLTQHEIDMIIIALRMVNKMSTGKVRSELEEKLEEYSMIARGFERR